MSFAQIYTVSARTCLLSFTTTRPKSHIARLGRNKSMSVTSLRKDVELQYLLI
jgi:hypothetical protein